MSTVAAPAGFTPQGTQYTAGAPNGSNTTPPPGGNLTTGSSDQDFNSATLAAAGNVAQANSTGQRQADVNAQGIPAEQTNYDQLVNQLAQYDQGTLAPQFQGTSSTPSDAVSFGDNVQASPLGMTSSVAANDPLSTLLGSSNPTNAFNMQDTQSKNILSLLNSLNTGMSSRLGTAQAKSGADVNAAQAILDSILKLKDQKNSLLTTQADEQNRIDLQNMQDSNNLLMEEIKDGYVDPSTLKLYIDGAGGTVDISKLKTKVEQAKAIRDAYSSATTVAAKTRIATQAKQLGITLTPTKLNTADMTQIRSDTTAMNEIAYVQRIMKQYGNQFPTGPAAQMLLMANTSGAGGIIGNWLTGGNPKLKAILDNPEINTALSYLNLLGLSQEKMLLGVRGVASPQMYKLTKASFPQVTRSQADNMSLLNAQMDVYKHDVAGIATNNQYMDSQDMATNEGLSIPGSNSGILVSPDGKSQIPADSPNAQAALSHGWKAQ